MRRREARRSWKQTHTLISSTSSFIIYFHMTKLFRFPLTHCSRLKSELSWVEVETMNSACLLLTFHCLHFILWWWLWRLDGDAVVVVVIHHHQEDSNNSYNETRDVTILSIFDWQFEASDGKWKKKNRPRKIEMNRINETIKSKRQQQEKE